jgi:UDP:flavonoid glycosyltransferase YjiC (YdhE family)
MPPAQFLAAARSLAAAGFATTFVGPTAGRGGRARPGAASLPRLACVAALPQTDLAALMRGARLVIANGGSTLLQAIACGAPCVAAPIAGDQRERIRRCAAAGVAVEAAPSAADLEAKARALLEDEPARAALARRAARSSSRTASRSLSMRSQICAAELKPTHAEHRATGL